MIFNYKRVSTTDQNTECQLLNIACDREYVEKISGKIPTVPNFKQCYSISVLVMWLMCIPWTDLLVIQRTC